MQRNLRLDVGYEMVSSWYSSIEDGGGRACDNCGRIITNCAEIIDTNGKRHVVGMDCVVTLIEDSFTLMEAQASFQQAKSARAKVLKYRKANPDAPVRVETFPEGKGYYKENGSGVVGVGDWWKQYPASVWQPYVLPMLSEFV